MKSDYKPGEVVACTNDMQTIFDEKDSFCTTNLLAHDKITGFLQNYTAQDKTSELSVMWDENNYSKILTDITELYNELEKRKTQLTSEIKKKERELKQYKIEKNQSERIKTLLLEYETKYNMHLMGDNFDIEKIILFFNQFHEESQREREEQEKECNDIEILLREYPAFKQNQEKTNLLREKKEKYDNAIDIWNKIEQTHIRKEKNIKETEQAQYLLNNLEEFYSYLDKFNKNLAELRQIENKKLECQKKEINAKQHIQELEEKLKNDNIIVEDLKTQENQLKRDFYEYNNYKLNMTKYNRMCINARCILEQRTKRIQDYALYLEQLAMFLEEKVEIELLCNVLSDEIIEKYSLIMQLKAEKKILHENNKILESNKNNLVELYSKVQQLSIKGRDIVTKQKGRVCPLCHMEYQDSDELLSRINTTEGRDEQNALI